MGGYANEPALRALAAIANEHLVVIDARTGPNVDRNRGRPYDRCIVYSPGDNARVLAKAHSWANDIVPVLVRLQDGGKLSTDPTYRVIVHNGAPPGSVSGHFSATRVYITSADLALLANSVLMKPAEDNFRELLEQKRQAKRKQEADGR